jgi:hypothetical protein
MIENLFKEEDNGFGDRRSPVLLLIIKVVMSILVIILFIAIAMIFVKSGKATAPM